MNIIKKIVMLWMIITITGCASQMTYEEPSEAIEDLTYLEKVQYIDEALFLTDTFIFIYNDMLYNKFPLNLEIDDRIIECINQKGSSVIGGYVVKAIQESITRSELEEGFDIAYSLTFMRTTNYVKLNYKQIYNEYKMLNEKNNLSNYMLLMASKLMGFNEKDNQKVLELVAWHATVHERIRNNSNMDSNMIVGELNNIYKECKDSISKYKRLFR